MLCCRAVCGACLALALFPAGIFTCAAEDSAPAPQPRRTTAPMRTVSLESTSAAWPAAALQAMCLAFSPDGQWLAVGHGYWNSPGLLRVWALPEQECVYQRPLPLGLSSLAFAGDANSLAYTGWGALFAVRDLQTGQSGPVMPFERSVGRFALSSDCRRAVTATEGYAPTDDSGGRVVRIWNPRTGELHVECAADNLCRLMCVAYSPTGEYVAAAGGVFRGNPVGRINLWNAATGKLVRTLDSPRAPIDVMRFSPDGKQLATGANDGTVRLWSVASGKEVRAWEKNRMGIMALAFSPDGAQLAAGTEPGTAAVWSTETGDTVQTLRSSGGRVLALQYSPDGRTIAGGTESGRLILWNAATGLREWETSTQAFDHLTALSHVLTLHGSRTVLVASRTGVLHELSWPDGTTRRTFAMGTQPVAQLASSADAVQIAALDTQGAVAVWDRATGQELLRLSPTADERITAIALVGAPSLLAVGNTAGTIQLWQLGGGVIQSHRAAHRGAVQQLRGGAVGKWLASADSREGEVKLWDLPTLNFARTIADHTGTISALGWSPGEETLIVAGEDRRLTQWDGATGAALGRVELPTEPIVSLAVAPEGQGFAGATASGTLTLWPFGSGSARQTQSGEKVSTIEWSSDGRQLLAANGSDRLQVWQTTTTPVPLATLTSEGGNRVAAAFSPNGRWFASGGDDRLVTVRDVQTGEIAKVLPGHRSVVFSCEFSRDGRWLATGGLEGTVRLWDTTTWRMRQALPHRGTIRAIGFSPDSQWIATGTSERAACLWDVETGRKLLELADQPAWVMGVAFSPDQQTFYTATGSWNPADAAIGSRISSWRIEPSKEGWMATAIRHSLSRAGSIECLRITKDGRRLITSGTDSQIVLWNPQTLVPEGTISHNAPFHRGALLPGDQLFAGGDGAGHVGIWDLTSKQRLRSFSGHTGHVFDVAISADGEILASASEDDRIQFWSATGREHPTSEWKRFIAQVRAAEIELRP